MFVIPFQDIDTISLKTGKPVREENTGSSKKEIHFFQPRYMIWRETLSSTSNLGFRYEYANYLIERWNLTHGPHLGGKCVDMVYIVNITVVT